MILLDIIRKPNQVKCVCSIFSMQRKGIFYYRYSIIRFTIIFTVTLFVFITYFIYICLICWRMVFSFLFLQRIIPLKRLILLIYFPLMDFTQIIKCMTFSFSFILTYISNLPFEAIVFSIRYQMVNTESCTVQ